MFGLLNVDKPVGMTSRDVVNRVQRLVRPVKVGHAGTLDPLATGVLIVCLGPATRLVPYLQRFRKTYLAEFQLGVTSDTDDSEGELIPTPGAGDPTDAAVEAALGRFVGRIWQVPPAHSAVKVQGRRAYDLARRGEEVALAAREVEIDRIELRSRSGMQLTVELECSSGTYVRSVGRDLGVALGTGAVMTGLRRTRIGPFSTSDAMTLTDLSQAAIADRLQPASLAVTMLGRHAIDLEEERRLRQGQRIGIAPTAMPQKEVAVVDAGGRLIAIGEEFAEGLLAPRIVFPEAEGAL